MNEYFYDIFDRFVYQCTESSDDAVQLKVRIYLAA